MPSVKFSQALNQLKEKKFQPIYFFHGEESFFIDQLTSEIEHNVLPESQKAFNQTVIYGKDIEREPGKLIDIAMRLPMMAERQVILVKEAQNIKNWDQLVPYLKNPTPTTLLAFAFKCEKKSDGSVKKLDGRSAFAKLIKKQGIYVENPALRDYQVPNWINTYVQEFGFTIRPKASHILVEFLGTSLSKLSNELRKLFVVMEGKEITPKIIEDNIGISKDFNVFELQNAMMQKDKLKVFKILEYFKSNPKAGNIVFVNTMLFTMFAKLYTLSLMKGQTDRSMSSKAKVSPYFLKDYKAALQKYSVQQIKRNIQFIHEYDLRSKGLNNGNTPPEELMREMAFKLMI